MRMNRVNFEYFFPKDFFKTEVHERFQLFLLDSCFGPFNNQEIRWGNPNNREPDLIISGRPFELTLASTEEEPSTYILDIKNHTLTSDNIENLSIECIKQACIKKSNKNYSTADNTVSILLMIPVFVWCMPLYSNVSDLLPSTRFSELICNIKNTYIDSGKFKDVLIHMPGFAYDWFSFTCKENRLLKKRCLNDKDIYGKELPYVIKRGSITTEEVML